MLDLVYLVKNNFSCNSVILLSKQGVEITKMTAEVKKTPLNSWEVYF